MVDYANAAPPTVTPKSRKIQLNTDAITRIRTATIETVGEQGDGIAKVERGYVVIIPGGQPGDEPTVKIDQVRDNVAFASIVDTGPREL